MILLKELYQLYFMMESKASWKRRTYCMVPRCKSNSVDTPGKKFISLPTFTSRKQKKARKLWLRAMRRNEDDISSNTRGFVCEDHFNLEKDMENYIRYKLMGGRIILKENVVPHIFSCQSERKLPMGERSNTVKRIRRNLVADLLSEPKACTTVIPTTESNVQLQISESAIETQEEVIKEQVDLPPENMDSTHKDKCLLSTCMSMGTQTSPKLLRTVCTQYRPKYRSKFQQTVDTPAKIGISVGCSPSKSTKLFHQESPELSETTGEKFSTTDYSVSSGHCSSVLFSSFGENLEERSMSITAERSKQLVISNSIFYLGILNDCHFIINLLHKYGNCTVRDICITLKKIRTNLPFQHVGDDFGISASNAAKVFKKHVPILSCFLEAFIIWPPKEDIKLQLPIAFRAKYFDVQSIIDCFGIEIEKPSDPVKQAATWSQYEKTNTMKYLISSTPDGIMNFASNGFGGRTTDITIVENSDFLKVLPTNCSVMADRGFKRIDTFLAPLDCKLIRLPSVRAGIRSTKEEVIETKKIAALRIHIERVIRRVREFKILKPYSCINNKTIRYLDHIVTIVCGLMNLQSAIIKR